MRPEQGYWAPHPVVQPLVLLHHLRKKERKIEGRAGLENLIDRTYEGRILSQLTRSFSIRIIRRNQVSRYRSAMTIPRVQHGKQHETRSSLFDHQEVRMEAAGEALALKIEDPRRVDILL